MTKKMKKDFMSLAASDEGMFIAELSTLSEEGRLGKQLESWISYFAEKNKKTEN